METRLLELLRERERIIADHAWRDRDAAGHLDALRDVSMAISAWVEANAGNIDARLLHFLENASYAKARAVLEARLGK